MSNPSPFITAPLGYMPRETLEKGKRLTGTRVLDLRAPGSTGFSRGLHTVDCEINDARTQGDRIGLFSSGFSLVLRETCVRDWFDESDVTTIYYEECRALAKELTGATHAFTFDHLIREPGKQTAGGGTIPGQVVTGAESGGGYVSGVHMDYTEHSQWADYLKLHGIDEPSPAARVISLNFWRPICKVVETNPLAVCDGRTVHADDLLETTILGYGHPGYSWHDVGVSVYDVAYSPRHRWYYYPKMTREEVLIMKTYDSRGVIGSAPPHASFVHPFSPSNAAPRCSIELRVLCYIGID